MCSIAGLINVNGNDVTPRLVQMLYETKHRGPDGCGVYVNGIVKKADEPQNLKIDGMVGKIGLGHSRLQITGDTGVQPLRGCDKRFVLGFNGEIWNYKKIKDELISKGHLFKTDSDGEVIVHLIEEQYKMTTNLADSVLRTNKILDGEYAFAVFDDVTKTITLTRDVIGIKQLYYGQNNKYLAFCSEKKPLWEIGINPKRVLPGQTVMLNYDTKSKESSFEVVGVNELQRPHITLHDENDALSEYQQVLFEAVRKRIDGREKVGIIFSGGIDSVLIARVAQMLSCNITCYACGFKDSSDITAARKAADELGLELKVHELTEKEVQAELENIILAIESSNHLQVDVAIPIFFAVKEAKKDSIRVMLTGQGADEIFAGYPWYPEILQKQGPEKLDESLWNDIKNLYKDTLEREDKITMYHSIELRVPYLDPEVIKVAMSIPDELKIKDNHVKYLHRRLAQKCGISTDLAWRKKEAAQHGSEVHDRLLKIINQMHITISNIPFPSKSAENLGSAYRYNHDVYLGNELVQNVLDSIGVKAGINPII